MKRDPETCLEPELSIYRSATIWMLRKYFNISVELGRLPSPMGREFFRSQLRCHPVAFERFVVYALDIENCVRRLRRDDQELIKRVVLQEYTQEEAARLMNWPVIRVERRLPEVLDMLTDQFIRLHLMKVPAPTPAERDEASPDEVGCTIVDQLSACADDAPGDRTSTRNYRKEDFSHVVPVEIMLSSPLNVTKPFNSYVP